MDNYIFDSHVHSNNSFDATDSIEDICKYAIKKEINGFCITDHLDVNEYNDHMEKCIKKSYEEAICAKEKYKHKVSVRAGVELGQPLQNLKIAEEVINKYNYDFIIGSMHNVKDEKDFYFMKEWDFTHRIDELLIKYYEEYYDMVRWGNFDVIGHITYPLRYIEGIFKIKIDMSKYNDIIYEMLRLASTSNIGIEVNVSGFRQSYGKQFPNLDHIKMYKKFGGEIITLGSDSHNKHDSGENFKEGKEILLEAGFKHYCEFENRNPKIINIK